MDIGRRIRKGHKTYRILARIGSWGQNLEYPVYEAVRLPQRVGHPRIAVKLITRVEGDDSWTACIRDVNNVIDCFCDIDRPNNILTFQTAFVEELRNVYTIFIGIPYETVRNVRSLLVNGFSGGMPMTCIATVMKNAVSALKDLHHYDLTSGTVSAGTTFYTEDGEPSIKMAYGPTSFERDTPDDPEGFRPINLVADWGQAIGDADGDDVLLPEDSESESEDSDDEPEFQKLEKKRDVWLLGVLALELSYGKIKVKSRDEFLRVIAYITRHAGLPNTWRQLRNTARFNPGNQLYNPRFTVEFISFLKCCLEPIVSRRPTARALAAHDFIKHAPPIEHFVHSMTNNLGGPILQA